VLWLGPWDEADPKAEQEAARKMLCSLAREYPSHGFECRAERFSAAALEEILALPPDLPVVISVDLDFLLRRDGRVDFSRSRRLQQVLGHFARPRAISAALSRPYFSDDASFEAALRLFSAALWTTPTVGATGLDLTEVQHDDRSLKAKELHDAGKPLPKPRWEQAASTPGLRIVNAPPHAAFGLLGDVYRSDANAPIPTEPPLAARRASWQPTESLPLIANLETPVADQLPLQGYPRFNAHASLLDRLAAEGVLIVNLANNHALDQGVEGLQTTIRAAHDRGIGVVGAWLPGDSGSGIERLQIGDLKCAFLGVTSRLNEHAREASAIDYVPFEEYPQSRSSREAESRFLQKVRDATNGADLVVVLVHGGNEYSSAPSMGQKRFFHALAEAGARVIAGTHSHRAGPVELTNGTLMAWGLGDYFLDQRGSGMGLRVYAERDGESVQVRFEEMKARGRSPRAEDRMPGVEGSTNAAAP
jgi:poly-gamma-glutamate synthesis protein (capsule biosynthesis protein)